ncbi:hypothetical protein HELRODRAFT_141216, partial [Helobdella robusta]|uniref:C2H2-type domain-containing protein n=1 Tax=Helobdella robusta TaxID=6412 RepID=T1EJ31_HELRO
SLKFHMRYHGADAPFKCEHCSRMFLKHLRLKHNYYISNHKNRFKCVTCSFSFNTETQLKVHMSKFKHFKVYKCSICYKTFIGMSIFLNHRRLHFQPKYKCKYCPFGVFNLKILKRHELTHKVKNGLKCKYCPYHCKESKTLMIHMNLHMNERAKFKCHLCTYGSQCVGWLNIHMKVHTEEYINKHYTNWRCDRCPFVCTSYEILRRHISMHIYKRTYACLHCTYTASSMAYLVQHGRLH